jgi:hypothetical protein
MKYKPAKFRENLVMKWQHGCDIQDGGGGHLEFQ